MRSAVLPRAFAVLCAAAAALPAAAQTKIGLINVQQAIASTQEGQKLIKELEEKYKPTRDKMEAANRDLAGMRDRLQKGANTMSDEARRNLMRDIQTKERNLQRDMEDARGEFNQEQNELFNAVGTKLMAVIDKYSKDNGLSIVLDISNPQSPVLYAVNEVNITNAIVSLYDAEHAEPAAAAPDPAE